MSITFLIIAVPFKGMKNFQQLPKHWQAIMTKYPTSLKLSFLSLGAKNCN